MADNLIGKKVMVVTTGRIGTVVGDGPGYYVVSYGDGNRKYRVLAQNVEALPVDKTGGITLDTGTITITPLDKTDRMTLMGGIQIPYTDHHFCHGAPDAASAAGAKLRRDLLRTLCAHRTRRLSLVFRDSFLTQCCNCGAVITMSCGDVKDRHSENVKFLDMVAAAETGEATFRDAAIAGDLGTFRRHPDPRTHEHRRILVAAIALWHGRDCLKAVVNMQPESTPLPSEVAEYLAQHDYRVTRAMVFNLYSYGDISFYAPETHIGVFWARKFCEAVPDVSARFCLMAGASPEWASIVKNWRLICDLMDYECPDWRATMRPCALVNALLDDIYSKVDNLGKK